MGILKQYVSILELYHADGDILNYARGHDMSGSCVSRMDALQRKPDEWSGSRERLVEAITNKIFTLVGVGERDEAGELYARAASIESLVIDDVWGLSNLDEVAEA